MKRFSWLTILLIDGLFASLLTNFLAAAEPAPLSGTRPLEWTGDMASRMIDGIDRFLLRENEAAVAKRAAHWKRDLAPERYDASVAPNRARLEHILGLRDQRISPEGLELLGTTGRSSLVGQGRGFKVFSVRWPAFGDVHGEGLLLVPAGREAVAEVVALPDTEQTPEMLAGLDEGIAPESQFARILAESGCRVVVPMLINRQIAQHGRAKLSNREFLYRSAFMLGRHPIGYELQKVLACIDWFSQEAGKDARIGVMGHGEGGLLALYAGALDTRIDAVGVSGYFDCRENLWQEPIDRNVFGLLDQFGDAELASMVWPRTLVVDAAQGPQGVLPRGSVGAPGRLVSPKGESVRGEIARASKLVGSPSKPNSWPIVVGDGAGPFGSEAALVPFLKALSSDAKLASSDHLPQRTGPPRDPAARHARQMHELDRHTQRLLAESPYVRQNFMAKLNTDSLETFTKTVEPYRTLFRDEVIGRFDRVLLEPNPRTRKILDEAGYTGHEIVLDVFPDVFAYGILLMPKGMKAGEKRPVVVCQHGLEGRPRDVLAGGNKAYAGFATRLVEQGFIVFAPQNPYIFKDRFRALQRKANPLGKTLFSIIVPQHQQITDWLASLPQVDDSRIAFYGLSYGGKSAMRIPPLVENYCLSICSGDFNDWVWKCASTLDQRYPYVWTGEYEIYEFDLGSTFNYAEMAALIAPRPFMVERGHFDGVAPDERVGYEFAKVRHLYQARLGLGERCEIEWFAGPHAIHGAGTFAFLKKHLGLIEK